MGRSTELRQHADCIRAANMRAEGWTFRQIADVIGVDASQVKARIELGQRLLLERKDESKKDTPQ